ncbi:ExbD/TolR family protein [Mariniflexile jejuense]|uniref:ExbD/TolR family protein n=1 Tax=Mariniflexile jejuense TaxID=1173582 RepID=A0ABW3JMF4_9FLAO
MTRTLQITIPFLIICGLILTDCKSSPKYSAIDLKIPEMKTQSVDSLKSILIKIDEKENYYLNDNIVAYDSIIKKMDSLGIIGFDQSKIYVQADKKTRVSAIVRIMELAKENKKKMELIPYL